MDRSMVAVAALCAGIAIASPMLAWSASEVEPRIAQAGPRSTRYGPGMGHDMGPGMGMGGGPAAIGAA